MTKVGKAIRLLKEHGYKEYSSPPHKYAVWSGAKRLPADAPQCETNEGKISWHASLYEIGEHHSAEVEIGGERNGEWFALKCYALNLGDLPTTLPPIEDKLLAAWSAL